MHLLNVHTLKLETFHHHKPRYAIASHRWIEGTESSFQDIQASRNLDRLGYKKIENLAVFVRSRLCDVDYIWIDTCCIDKTNSQELQEAITAMYKWYEGAAICIVYLNDVQDVHDATRESSLERIRQSVWFTRGWTLQELLAPALVVFLSADWKVLGHKAHDNNRDLPSPLDQPGLRLNSEIANITGIPEVVIGQPEQRRFLSVKERLAWTSTRTTTRPEDMAYCLLGLFEVSMPLIYQEGQTAAQRRLMRAVFEASNDAAVRTEIENSLGDGRLSIADVRQAQSANRVVPSSTVPFLRDAAFIDRTEMRQLEQRLSIQGTRVALVGLGGVGKSQLAIEYCYRLRERCPDTWVLWVHAGSEARYEQSLRKLAADADIPNHKDVTADIFEMMYHWLRDIRNGKWLLVLDSADDADFLFMPPSATAGNATQINEEARSGRTRLDYLPICAHGSILVTSRYRAVAAKIVDDHDLLPVLPMGQADALALLNARIGHKNDAEASEQLTAALDYMPLAIAQAAAYIKNRWPRCSIKQYLEKLAKSSKLETRLLSTASVELRRNQEAENSIILTWQVSFNHVRSLRQSAADLLSLMSFFDHQSIPECLLRDERVDQHTPQRPRSDCDDDSVRSSSFDSDADDEAFEDDLAILKDYDFISLTPSGKELKMHRLIQLASRKWLESRGQYEQWLAQSIQRLDSALPLSSHETWQRCEVLYPHARLMLDLAPIAHDSCVQKFSILDKATWFAFEKHLASEAEVLAYHCKKGRERILGRNNEQTLDSTELLAVAIGFQGRHEEAEQMNRRVVEARQKLLGPEHPSTLASLNRLALMLRFQAKYDEFEQITRRVLEVQERVLGAEHPNTISSVENLALVMRDQGKYEESKQMNQRALEVREKVLGPAHPDTLSSLYYLASSLRHRGKYKEAEQINRRALERATKVLGPEHSSTLESMSDLASMLLESDKHEESEEVYRRVLAASEKVRGPEHPDTLLILSQLATALDVQGNKAIESREMYQRALKGQEKVLGPEHYKTLTSVMLLASYECEQQRYDIAIPLYDRVSAGLTEFPGPLRPFVVKWLDSLSSKLETKRQM